MTLSAGTRFGPYEIAEEIGAGGMGVVYRATDTKLKRDVAVKVLPESLASDEERLTRFQREAELLASLNHPNIAQIHGLEDADGAMALVMELVEGPTLEDRIKQGALPPDEALSIAMQIAEALEGAHGQGIVHRDLKPANIKLRPDGVVKVLDFGIAKALEPDVLTSEPQSPMLTTPATQVGVILGTAAYMSPEQARGKQVDQRADIWAFGCVLYEMLTGQPAFGAEDVPLTLARVLDREADLDSLPASIPSSAHQTIELCLQKDVKQRLQAIGDARLALEGKFETASPQVVPAASVARPIWQRPLPAAVAAALLGAMVVSLSAWILWPTVEPRPVSRFDYELLEGQVWIGAGRPVMDLSTDGRRFVYGATGGLHMRTMDELEARVIPGVGEVARSPSLSPDGQSVVYYDIDQGDLKQIAVSGGAPVPIADVESNMFGLSWEADGTILFGQPDGIFRVAATGGTPELVIPTEDGMQAYGPRLMPDDDSVLFSLGPRGDWDAAQIVVQSLSTGERQVLVEGGYDARYVPSGHIVYAFGDGLFAVAFDPTTGAVSGGAVPLVQGVMRASITNTGASNYAVSEDGTLVYVSGSIAETAVALGLVWVDREGRQEPINVPPRGYVSAQLSPDGTRVAISDIDEQLDTWILDLERGARQRLTFDPGFNSYSIWSPDGERVAFTQSINGILEVFWQAADGSGTPEPLTEDSVANMLPTDLTPDGTRLLYASAPDNSEPGDIWMIPVDGPPTAGIQLLATPADEGFAKVSPDGRWLAYQSDESGRNEIYVRPFPEVNTGRWQVSIDGGENPLWSRDGTELFYFVSGARPTPDAMMAVSVDLEETFSPAAPELLFRGEYSPLAASLGSFYDVSLDGQQFLMIASVGVRDDAERQQIIIVENWFEELNQLVPTE